MGEEQKEVQEKEVMFRELYSRYMEEVKRGESLDFLPVAGEGQEEEPDVTRTIP